MSAEIPTGYRLPLVDETTWRLPDPTMDAISSDMAGDVGDLSTPFGAAFSNALVSEAGDPDSPLGGSIVATVDQGLVAERAPRNSLIAQTQSRPRTNATVMHAPGYFYPMHKPGVPLAPAAGSWATDTEYLYSWAVDQAVSIDRLGFRVLTGSAGLTADVAIYHDNQRARPGKLFTSVTGTAMTPSGSKNLTVAPPIIQPGVYWIGVTFHGDVSTFRVECLPIGGGYYPAPLSPSNSVPAASVAPAGLSRPGRTGAPSDVLLSETLAPADNIPRIWFRPSITAVQGRALLHDSEFDERGLTNYAGVVTPEHVTVIPDPVLGNLRQVVSLNTHETDTSITANPRTQLEPYSTIAVGSETWAAVGFLFKDTFPATWNNSYWMTIAEVYGTPYGGTSPFRLTIVQGAGGISIAATKSAAYGAGPANVWVKPLSGIRNKWLDVALKFVLSPDPAVGYYELWINEGNGMVQQQLNGVNRLYGSTVVAGINDGGPNTFQVKNYRMAGSPVTESTVYVANHRVGTSLAEVDPRSHG